MEWSHKKPAVITSLPLYYNILGKKVGEKLAHIPSRPARVLIQMLLRLRWSFFNIHIELILWKRATEIVRTDSRDTKKVYVADNRRRDKTIIKIITWET